MEAIKQKFPFLISKEAARCFDLWDINWNDVDENYKQVLLDRINDATNKSLNFKLCK